MPGTGGAASYGDLLITSLVVLAGVCIAAFVVVKVVGRFLATGRMRGAHLLDVVARLPLEPRRSLYVVEVAGKTLLVGTSEMGLSVLSELDGAEVKARAAPKQSFGELVRSAWLGRRGVDASEARHAHVGTSEARDAHVGTNEARDAHVGTNRARDAHVGTNKRPHADTETRSHARTSVVTGVSAETRPQTTDAVGASEPGGAHPNPRETKAANDREGS